MYRYIGNKNKIVGEILSEIEKVIGDCGWIADIMCGTGCVSSALRQAGYNVIASDVMTYSVCHARVLLLLNGAPKFNKLVLNEKFLNGVPEDFRYSKILDHLNELTPVRGYFFREFSPDGTPSNGSPPRKYFTGHNASKIDAIRLEMAKWEIKGLLDENEKALLIHDLIMSVNEVANISGTYGHYHSTFVNSSHSMLHLKPSFQPGILKNISTNHIVMQGYAEELAQNINADLCYIDPPYMKRQYAANYHILETIARGDEPEAVGLSGLRPWRDQYSNFCSKLKIRDSFRAIISNIKCSDFLISYSEDGLLSCEEIINLLKEFGDVSYRQFSNKRFRSNNSYLDYELTEYIFQLKKG